MKIRFTVDRWLDTEDRTKVPKFKKGSTHDLSEASAYRWTRRGFAVYVVAEPVVEVKLDRPMMAETRKYKADEIAQAAWSQQRLEGSHQERADKPTKRGRKPKGA